MQDTIPHPANPDEVAELEQSPGQSLSDRMDARAEVLERQQAEFFPIPGFEGIVDVELRALGYKTIRAAQRRNERVRDPDLQELYNIADQLLIATVGFREMPSKKSLDDDWMRLAQRRHDFPESVSTPRQALIWLVGEKRIHFLAEDWGKWARSVRSDVDEEVAGDFE